MSPPAPLAAVTAAPANPPGMNDSAATFDCMTMQNATTPITIHATLCRPAAPMTRVASSTHTTPDTLGAFAFWGPCFYAAGGKREGLPKTVAANGSGGVWVPRAHLVIGAAGLQSVAWIVIGVVAFCIVMQSKVAALSFIPGGFAGAAVTAASGAGGDIKANVMVAVALIAGAVLGYISEMGAGMIAKKA